MRLLAGVLFVSTVLAPAAAGARVYFDKLVDLQRAERSARRSGGSRGF